jgi:predicted transcriptional regulator of viral defense system
MKNKRTEEYLSRLSQLGLFRLADARLVGVPQRTLSWLVKKGEIIRIGSDAYHHKVIVIPPGEEDFAAACFIFGDSATIGGATALFHYNLIEQVPSQIWVLVPPATTNHNPKYRLIRTKSDLSIGIESHQWFRITSVERTIVDAFHFQTKIGGLEMALRAARQAIKNNMVKAHNILKVARQLGWEKNILDHWEAMTLD